MTTKTYALCAGRHNIMVDGEDVTEKSVYPMTVERPLDFEANIATAQEFIYELVREEYDKVQNEINNVSFQLVVTGLTPVLHAFIKAWHLFAPHDWVLTLGHYDRDGKVYIWQSLFDPMNLHKHGRIHWEE